MKNWLSDIQPRWYLLTVPLLFFPLMVNARIFPFVAPNEEPKWALLVLCGLLMALAAGWLCWRSKEIFSLRISLPGTLLAVFCLILAIGVFIGANVVEGMIRFTFWMAAVSVWLLAVWASRHDGRWHAMLGWWLSIGALIFSLRYWWSYVLDYGKPGYNVSVLFSPVGHVNFTGDVLVVLLPALIWLLAVRNEPLLKVINWFSVATAVTVLLVASSRGAIGGLIVGLLSLLPFMARQGREWLESIRNRNYRLAPPLWVGSALLASLIVYNLLPYHYRELARVSGTLQASFEQKGLTEGVEQPPLAGFWNSLSSALGARTPMYASATAMTLDAPWLGHGTGNFAWIYPGYSNRYPDFHDPLSSERTFTTNPHNIVLQLTTQNGIPAALIFLSLLGFLLARLRQSLWRQWNGWLAAGSVAMTAALFDSMFNHVFFNPASMFVFALLGGTWWGSVASRGGGDGRNVELPARFNRPAALFLVTLALALSVWPTRWLVSEWNVGYAMAYMKYPAKAAAYYERAYGWDRYNFRALFGVAQSAYRERRFGDAINLLREFEAVYPYNPPALNMLGAAYMMAGRINEAEQAFQRTLKVLPTFRMAQQNLTRVQTMIKSRQQAPAMSVPWRSK